MSRNTLCHQPAAPLASLRLPLPNRWNLQQLDWREPIPFGGMTEASGQHLEGIAVHEQTVPDQMRLQYLARLRQMGLPVPETYITADYHTAEAKALPPILDWEAVEAQLDTEAFLRDGVAVLRGVWLPAATSGLLESCVNVQRENDKWIDHDWHEPSQWAERGLNPPTCPPLTEVEKNEARGKGQVLHYTLGPIFRSVKDNNPETVAGGAHFGLGMIRDERTIRWPSGIAPGIAAPELLPIMYDDFLLECISHPQMVRFKVHF